MVAPHHSCPATIWKHTDTWCENTFIHTLSHIIECEKVDETHMISEWSLLQNWTPYLPLINHTPPHQPHLTTCLWNVKRKAIGALNNDKSQIIFSFFSGAASYALHVSLKILKSLWAWWHNFAGSCGCKWKNNESHSLPFSPSLNSHTEKSCFSMPIHVPIWANFPSHVSKPFGFFFFFILVFKMGHLLNLLSFMIYYNLFLKILNNVKTEWSNNPTSWSFTKIN